MKKSAKIPAILLGISTLCAMIAFSISRNYPIALWGAVGFTVFAVTMGLMVLTRFLRNRSIISGLFMSTTLVTIIYFIGSRFVNNTLPFAFATANIATADTATNFGLFSPIFFAQIGLFALWFLLILFIIYVYVRPIRKIDMLLSQIIECKDIKKIYVGKSSQYRNIEAKLQILAEEKRLQELKKQNARAKYHARTKVKEDVVKEILKEKEKIPTANTPA